MTPQLLDLIIQLLQDKYDLRTLNSQTVSTLIKQEFNLTISSDDVLRYMETDLETEKSDLKLQLRNLETYY